MRGLSIPALQMMERVGVSEYPIAPIVEHGPSIDAVRAGEGAPASKLRTTALTSILRFCPTDRRGPRKVRRRFRSRWAMSSNRNIC